MSLAARCPACGTVFRVVQDQLRVSEGWVRCGRCAEVFNAIETLVDLDTEAAAKPAPRAPRSERVLEDLARVSQGQRCPVIGTASIGLPFCRAGRFRRLRASGGPAGRNRFS